MAKPLAKLLSMLTPKRRWLQFSLATLFASLHCGCESKPVAPTRATNANAVQPVATVAAEGSPNKLVETESRQDDQYVTFPAVGLRLPRPPGFDDAENFHGFQQASTQASVMVVMLPAAYSETAQGFTAQNLKTRGMTLDSQQDVSIDGHAGTLMYVTQMAYDIEFGKWIVILGDDSETLMITANFPKSHEATLSDELRSVILSAKFDRTDPLAPDVGVDFTIVASPKLKLTRGIGKMLLYTKDGVVPSKSPDDPLFLAAPSISQVPTRDRRQFALTRLFNTVNTRVSSVASTNEVTIDGLNGFESIADAENTKTHTRLTLYQVILFERDSYFLMQGLVEAERGDEFLPEFKVMANSLKRK